MAKVKAIVKLQIAAGQANPAPRLVRHWPTRCQYNGLLQEYNERTSKYAGSIIPVEITIFVDRTYKFITKTPPTSDLLKKALGTQGCWNYWACPNMVLSKEKLRDCPD